MLKSLLRVVNIMKKADIIVTKRDETLLNISSDDDRGILMEISEFFTFMAEGYKFMPSFRNKTWDGKIRIFNARNNTLPFGLLSHLVEFTRSRKYTINIANDIFNEYQPSNNELEEFVDSLYLTDNKGNQIFPRDYQVNGFNQAIKENKSLLISPTGSGKSLIIYMMLRWYLEHYDDNIIIIVPTTSLVSQMKKDFGDYSMKDDNFNAESQVHEIYSGKEKYVKDRFKITLENGRTIILNPDDKVKLSNNVFVLAKNLKSTDEINDIWLSKLT